jgi:hypothetical protein
MVRTRRPGSGATQTIESLGDQIAAVACRLAAKWDVSFAGLERHDGGWCLEFVDDRGSACGFELTFSERQVRDEAKGWRFDRGGLVALISERVDT